MQPQKVNRLYRAGRICLLSAVALLSLGSCRDDIQEPKESTHEQTPQTSIDNYIGKVNIVVEATLEPMPDQSGRGLSYSLIDRSEKIGLDGNTVPAGADYAGEFAPRMVLKEGDTERGFLIFYHDSGKVVRKAVAFDVIEGVEKKDGSIDPTAKNRVQFVGDIDFPAGVTLTDEFNKSSNPVHSGLYPGRIDVNNTTKDSGWHVMAMIGHQDVTLYYPDKDADGTKPDVLNHLLIGSFKGGRYQLASTESFDDASQAGHPITLNTPCASAWMPLYITKAPPKKNPKTGLMEESPVTGVNLGLHFKPQGVILQYDLASMATETQDLRRVGLVSNVLDFKGYYDLNSASIKDAFKSKDAKGYGLPKWVPDEPSMESLSMNYTPASDAPLSSGARVFPWDMPTLSSGDATALSNWPTPGVNEWKVEKGSVLSVYPLGNSDDKSTGRPKSYPWLKVSKLWTFYALGGTKTANSNNGFRKILYFWGMPRTDTRMPEASKRATYLFASSHSLLTDEDAWNAENGFDTDKLKKLVNLATEYANDLINRQIEIDATKDSETKKSLQKDYDRQKNLYETSEGKNRYRDKFPGATFPAARDAIQKASDYTRDANKSGITPRTQPLMVLHQTNRTFAERKVYHAQVVIRPDLMLSEVIYQKHDGKNYSLLEVYNTTVEPVDLTQYAIVRLIPSAGTHLAFRGKDGQPVESLDQALVLPLTALKGNADPFAGSALSSLKLAGYNYDDPTKRALPIYYSDDATRTLSGLWNGIWDANSLVDVSGNHNQRPFYLLEGQSILLGGSGYIQAPVTKKESSSTTKALLPEASWFEAIHTHLEKNHLQRHLRYAYAYADGVKGADGSFGEGTLDYRPGDAFALIKKTSTGWQIIDATGPVGPKHLAFAGSYSDFKTEMAKHESAQSFSLQRLDGVNYPFIAPFRTKRLTSKWSDDWNILTDVNQFTPGRRFDYAGMPHNFSNWNYSFKRTPIDTQFTTYQNARPTKGY